MTTPQIVFDDFLKVDIRIGEVVLVGVDRDLPKGGRLF